MVNIWTESNKKTEKIIRKPREKTGKTQGKPRSESGSKTVVETRYRTRGKTPGCRIRTRSRENEGREAAQLARTVTGTVRTGSTTSTVTGFDHSFPQVR